MDDFAERVNYYSFIHHEQLREVLNDSKQITSCLKLCFNVFWGPRHCPLQRIRWNIYKTWTPSDTKLTVRRSWCFSFSVSLQVHKMLVLKSKFLFIKWYARWNTGQILHWISDWNDIFRGESVSIIERHIETLSKILSHQHNLLSLLLSGSVQISASIKVMCDSICKLNYNLHYHQLNLVFKS